MKEIVIATRNEKKRKELQALLKDLCIRPLSLKAFGNIPKIKEDGKTFEANAIKKALVVSRFTDKLVLADDSGLEVEVLNRRPGVYSSRFSGKSATDQKNIRRLLRMMEDIPKAKRKARFRCCVAIAKGGVLLKVINGKCSGEIGFEGKGKFGFGYDPVFIAPRYGRAFAQLGTSVKNKISHRAKALKKAKKFIAEYFEGNR